MFTHAQLTIDIVWDDVLWRAIAWYLDDEGGEPVLVEKSGRLPGAMDMTIGQALAAAGAACAADRAEYTRIDAS